MSSSLLSRAIRELTAEIVATANAVAQTPRPHGVRVPRLTSTARVRQDMNRQYGE